MPVTRPILVELHNDRVIILPEDRPRELPKQTELSVKAQDNIDEFVNNVWQHMKCWGPAGKNRTGASRSQSTSSLCSRSLCRAERPVGRQRAGRGARRKPPPVSASRTKKTSRK